MRLFRHEPVLLDASIEWLGVRPGTWIVDGTVGGGGHAQAILEASAPNGRLLALDVDEEAVRHARERLRPFGDRVTVVQASFRHLERELAAAGVEGTDGVLLDLGVSSPQIDDPARGFRFSGVSEQTPLDMRMDRVSSPTAADLLAQASEATLVTWLQRYGELPRARRLARAIVRQRRTAPLRTAADLLRSIDESGVGRGRRHHPGTLVFQALRIAVNDELEALREGIEAAISALRPGGRVVVISYHSLEDRIVKNHFRDAVRGCICPPEVPACGCGRKPRLRLLTRKPQRPSESETRRNPRARSARLRAAERLPENS